MWIEGQAKQEDQDQDQPLLAVIRVATLLYPNYSKIPKLVQRRSKFTCASQTREKCSEKTG